MRRCDQCGGEFVVLENTGEYEAYCVFDGEARVCSKKCLLEWLFEKGQYYYTTYEEEQ